MLGNLSLCMAFSSLGFLPFNMPKARVFMGDIGSILLGAVFAGVGDEAGWHSDWEVEPGKAALRCITDRHIKGPADPGLGAAVFDGRGIGSGGSLASCLTVVIDILVQK
jgi:hypothetical protein